ncbi:hypothetical protein SBC1_78670 (plasmid) [Caballeronia sp. SBC1]|nr:hypothetical protein SBC1_78670 [Caballeronia sp. SBC1]
MDRKTAVAKIRKCLNLAGSAEPHEAAAALRQAQKLMAEFGVGDFELAGVGVDEAWVKSSAVARPPRFEVQLASVVAGAFGCEIVFTRRLNATRTRIVGGYAFIGVAPTEQITSYAFTVLAYQLRTARARYVAETLSRCQPRSRTARADQFCEGWVTAARRLVQASNASEPDALRLEGYLRAHYADTRSVALRSRAVARHVDPLVDKVRGFANGAKSQTPWRVAIRSGATHARMQRVVKDPDTTSSARLPDSSHRSRSSLFASPSSSKANPPKAHPEKAHLCHGVQLADRRPWSPKNTIRMSAVGRRRLSLMRPGRLPYGRGDF